ncbi:hypothetical protein RB195_026203 [Necator americanus]|uniref:Uncharacterized protein n=1 Tax=Necator americanus TaxID=51031 RepID=A0ABR1EVZ3_NECAM
MGSLINVLEINWFQPTSYVIQWFHSQYYTHRIPMFLSAGKSNDRTEIKELFRSPGCALQTGFEDQERYQCHDFSSRNFSRIIKITMEHHLPEKRRK